MEILLIILVGGPLVIGGAIAIYEWRKTVTLLKHDFSSDCTPQTEVERDTDRAAQVIREAIMRNIGGGSLM